MTKTLPITKAREDLTNLVENANKKLDEYIITVNGSPHAVIISADEYESWKETNDIMSNPTLLKDIKDAELDIKKGRFHDWEEVKRELGWDVQSQNIRKSKKTT